MENHAWDIPAARDKGVVSPSKPEVKRAFGLAHCFVQISACLLTLRTIEGDSVLASDEGAFVMLPPLFDPSPGFAEAKAFASTLRSSLDADVTWKGRMSLDYRRQCAPFQPLEPAWPA
jgi:hypothetical protein